MLKQALIFIMTVWRRNILTEHLVFSTERLQKDVQKLLNVFFGKQFIWISRHKKKELFLHIKLGSVLLS